ncbi:hypothetical protein RDI58_001122 [Solanum bulbocastanum]|uniref:DUF4283 domain-containing protein n=1 Tax=Solanum bulbocastanum TaxID=147425 RepID=A0AAN8YMX2_SOLBU
MLPSEGKPPQMAGLDPSSSSNFPPLNTSMVPNIHTTPITSSFVDIIKGHQMNDMIDKGKAIADVDTIPQKKPNLVGGIPTISWTANEIQRMNILENLQLVVLEDENTLDNRVVIVKIQYDSLPAYCKKCKLQGHGEDDCRVLHPKMVQQHDDREKVTQPVDGMPSYKGAIKSKWKPTNRNFIKNDGELMNTKVQESEGTIKNSFEQLDQPIMREVENNSHILQGGVEGIRSESTHEPVKAGGKMEVTVVEGEGSRASNKGPLVQMEDVMMINAGVNDEVNLEILRIDENNAEVAHQQIPNEQLEKNSLVHVSFPIPLQILEPSKERFPLHLQGSVVLTRKEEEHKIQDVKVVCFKSQPVQTLHEMVSHQGVVKGQETVNSDATEKSEEK